MPGEPPKPARKASIDALITSWTGRLVLIAALIAAVFGVPLAFKEGWQKLFPHHESKPTELSTSQTEANKTAPVAKPSSEPKPQTEANKTAPVAKPSFEAKTFVVYFNHGLTHLSPEGFAVVDEAANYINSGAASVGIICDMGKSELGEDTDIAQVVTAREIAVRSELLVQGVDYKVIRPPTARPDPPLHDEILNAETRRQCNILIK